MALDEATVGSSVEDLARQERGWKLFLLLPRLLLHRPPGGGLLSKEKLSDRFKMFSRGEWLQLLAASRVCDEKAATTRNRRRRRLPDDLERRAIRALQLVQMGELSSARQALEGAEIAPGSHAALQSLTNEDRRPAIPREPLPQDVIDFVPAVEFSLEDSLFCKTLRSARRGAACGPSGMTCEHFGLC